MILGLVFVAGIFVYIVISIAIVRVGIGVAKERGYPGYRGGWIAAIIMFLIPFWDWLPTVATHRLYCIHDSGFHQYVSMQEWSRKYGMSNIREELVYSEKNNATDRNLINNKVRESLVSEKLLFGIHEVTKNLTDTDDGKVIASFTDYNSGHKTFPKKLRDYKIWMKVNSCGGLRNDTLAYRALKKEISAIIRNNELY